MASIVRQFERRLMFSQLFDTSPVGIEALVGKGESQQVEFKTALPDDRTLARILTAFANTDGGLLLIGVSDTSGIIGVPEERLGEYMARAELVASRVIPWPVEIGGAIIRGLHVFYVLVSPGQAHLLPLLTPDGSAYVRKGATEAPVAIDTGPTVRPGTRPCTMRAFVAMSFHEAEEPALVDYFHAMERAAKATELPIDVVRIDLVEGDYEISQRVMDEIDASHVVIADFTLSPRNVYFELGYARGKGKRPIRTARQGTALEFDIRNWRTLFYRNATELEAKLVGALKGAYVEIEQDLGSRTA